MTENLVLTVLKDAIVTGIMISAPILLTATAVGLLIAIFQATTQIQEQTLTFVPKVLAVAAVGILTGSWMLTSILKFTQKIFEIIGNITY